MLRNLSKYYLFICCKQSSSTHFRHFLATAFVTDVLVGSNPPCDGPEKKKGLHRWRPNNSVVGDEGCRVRLTPPAFASGLRPSRAALENACAFPQLRTLAGSNPPAMGANKNGPLSGTASNSVVGDEGCRVRLAPPASASGLRPSRAALENASRFLSSAPLRVRIPLRWAQTKTVPFRGPFPIPWWAMRDSNPQPCACKAPALTVAPIARAERV